ncbi:MAG: hypothetical protein M3161_06385 [Actinomycetota bacterium]|nr:hypothetical protein [Actinomycetota bacterium]
MRTRATTAAIATGVLIVAAGVFILFVLRGPARTEVAPIEIESVNETAPARGARSRQRDLSPERPRTNGRARIDRESDSGAREVPAPAVPAGDDDLDDDGDTEGDEADDDEERGGDD